jgi:hypothetical protein
MVRLRERAQAGLLDGSAADAAAGAAAAAVAAGGDGALPAAAAAAAGAPPGAVAEGGAAGGNQVEQRALRNLLLLGLKKVKVRRRGRRCEGEGHRAGGGDGGSLRWAG